MNREQVMQDARAAGFVVESCADDRFIAVRAGEATNPNERMRMTSDGTFLIVHEGYYWQVGTTEDISNHLKARAQ